jgi:hypothetical protein
MNNRFSWIFLLASGAFFVFIVGLTGYRTEDTRRHNAAAARESAASLAAKVHSLVDITGSVQAPPFKSAMRTVFDADPRLLLISVHTPQDGILYFVSRSATALKEPPAITPQWRGTPSYRVNRGSEMLVSSSLQSTAPGMTMDAIFVVMGKEDLYPIVRDDLYFFLAFLLVFGVAILIVMSIDQDTGPGSASSRGEAPGARGTKGGWRPPAETTSASTASPRPSSGPSMAPVAPGAAGGLTSPRTGLVWGEYLQPRLKAELERAASSDADISFARLRIDEPFADSRLPMAYAEIARTLTESFPLRDLIFESGDDSYSLILPELDVDAAVRQLDEVRGKVAAGTVQGRTRTLSIGVTSRGGRLIDEKVLREEAQVAAAKAVREGGNQVVGFRADAARFRETLTGRAS